MATNAPLGVTQVVDPSNPGKCCDCAKQLGCTCPGANCQLVCQSRSSASGNATFVGYPEYTTPSNPPLYYRTQSLSGGWTAQCGPGVSCAGDGWPTCSGQYIFAGSGNYDKVTGAFTNTQTLDGSGGPGCGTFPSSVGVSGITTTVMGMASVTFNTQFITNNTQISVTTTDIGGCGTGTSVCCSLDTANSISSLGNRDLPSDAINRAVSGRPWAGTDCLANHSTTGTWGPGGRNFAFTQAQVQVVLPLPIAGHDYQVTVGLGQAPIAGGTVVPIGFLIFELTAPPTGEAISEFQPIPNVVGYNVYATTCVAVDIT